MLAATLLQLIGQSVKTQAEGGATGAEGEADLFEQMMAAISNAKEEKSAGLPLLSTPAAPAKKSLPLEPKLLAQLAKLEETAKQTPQGAATAAIAREKLALALERAGVETTFKEAGEQASLSKLLQLADQKGLAVSKIRIERDEGDPKGFKVILDYRNEKAAAQTTQEKAAAPQAAAEPALLKSEPLAQPRSASPALPSDIKPEQAPRPGRPGALEPAVQTEKAAQAPAQNKTARPEVLTPPQPHTLKAPAQAPALQAALKTGPKEETVKNAAPPPTAADHKPRPHPAVILQEAAAQPVTTRQKQKTATEKAAPLPETAKAVAPQEAHRPQEPVLTPKTQPGQPRKAQPPQPEKPSVQPPEPSRAAQPAVAAATQKEAPKTAPRQTSAPAAQPHVAKDNPAAPAVREASKTADAAPLEKPVADDEGSKAAPTVKPETPVSAKPDDTPAAKTGQTAALKAEPATQTQSAPFEPAQPLTRETPAKADQAVPKAAPQTVQTQTPSQATPAAAAQITGQTAAPIEPIDPVPTKTDFAPQSRPDKAAVPVPPQAVAAAALPLASLLNNSRPAIRAESRPEPRPAAPLNTPEAPSAKEVGPALLSAAENEQIAQWQARVLQRGWQMPQGAATLAAAGNITPQIASATAETVEQPGVSLESSTDTLAVSGENTPEKVLSRVRSARVTVGHFASRLKEAIENYKPPMMQISLTLNPQSLGSVEVILKSRGKNLQVSVSSNPQAIALFYQNSAEFRQNLQQMGFGDVSVSFGQESGNRDERGQSKNPYSQHAPQETEGSEIALEPQTMTVEIPIYG